MGSDLGYKYGANMGSGKYRVRSGYYFEVEMPQKLSSMRPKMQIVIGLAKRRQQPVSVSLPAGQCSANVTN